jgi:hypothetical protein
MNQISQAVVGIGLKTMHLPAILGGASPVELDFLEVHAENFMGAGGPLHARLDRVRERHALSVHGVGLGLGGAGALDRAHLARLARVLARWQPRWFSEHLAWSSHGGAFLNDLLPLPYTADTLARVCAHIDEAQDVLGRQLLLENPATYVEFAASTWDEAAFIAEVQRRTGCGLLLDVNNAWISAVNHGRDALTYVAALPLAAVGEIHLAGFAEDRDAAGAPLLIDHHGAPVAEAVWALYRFVLERTGPVPTLIERDHDVPAFEVLQAEAHRARDCMAAPGRAATSALSSALTSAPTSAHEALA